MPTSVFNISSLSLCGGYVCDKVPLTLILITYFLYWWAVKGDWGGRSRLECLINYFYKRALENENKEMKIE